MVRRFGGLAVWLRTPFDPPFLRTLAAKPLNR
jgi:hypothetical protein